MNHHKPAAVKNYYTKKKVNFVKSAARLYQKKKFLSLKFINAIKVVYSLSIGPRV